jgi:hypothetical protein
MLDCQNVDRVPSRSGLEVDAKTRSNMSLPNEERRQRMLAFVVKTGLLLFWVGGVCESVRFCFLPWKGHPDGPEELPFIEVGVLCGFITLQVLLLFAVLRPRDLSAHTRRFWVALPILICFLIRNYCSLRMGYGVQTDAPSLWPMLVDALTLLASIIAAAVFFWQRSSHARRSPNPTA